jgi:hypothetical protein
VRICPSTIWRRAVAASNMREVPDCGTALCDTPRQNASGRSKAVVPISDQPNTAAMAFVGQSIIQGEEGIA